MTQAIAESVPISKVVAKASTWNPARDAANDEIVYIDLSSVDNGSKSINGFQSIAGRDAPSRARQLVHGGDILVSTVRPNLNGVARVPDDLDGATASTGFCVLRPQPEQIDPSFLFHWVQSPNFIDDMVRKATGANYPAVSDKIIFQSEIPSPSLHEQRRIAAILDQADELRRKRQQATSRLSQLGQAIFNEMFGDPATNPKGFEALPLGQTIAFKGGSQPPKSNFLYEDGPDRVRFIQIRDFRTNKYPTYVPKALAKRPFNEDDVMIGRYGPPVFQIFRGLSGTYNVALMKAEPKLHLTTDFVFYLLQEPKLHAFVVANSERTAGQSGVNLELLEKYPAYAPPKELLQEFSERIAGIEKQISAYKSSEEASERLFSSLQHRAFRGEL